MSCAAAPSIPAASSVCALFFDNRQFSAALKPRFFDLAGMPGAFLPQVLRKSSARSSGDAVDPDQ